MILSEPFGTLRLEKNECFSIHNFDDCIFGFIALGIGDCSNDVLGLDDILAGQFA
jgi:hypothetical protein